MQIHVFKSAKPEVFGFTKDQSGSILPKSLGLWKYFKHLDVSNAEISRIGVNTDEMLSAIDKDGYYITSVAIRFTETVGG